MFNDDGEGGLDETIFQNGGFPFGTKFIILNRTPYILWHYSLLRGK